MVTVGDRTRNSSSRRHVSSPSRLTRDSTSSKDTRLGKFAVRLIFDSFTLLAPRPINFYKLFHLRVINFKIRVSQTT